MAKTHHKRSTSKRSELTFRIFTNPATLDVRDLASPFHLLLDLDRVLAASRHGNSARDYNNLTSSVRNRGPLSYSRRLLLFLSMILMPFVRTMHVGKVLQGGVSVLLRFDRHHTGVGRKFVLRSRVLVESVTCTFDSNVCEERNTNRVYCGISH